MSQDEPAVLRRQLVRYLSRVEGDPEIRVHDVVEPVVRGHSNLTTFFTLRRSSTTVPQRLVLKREPRGTLTHAVGVTTQRRLLDRLAEVSTVPVPRVLWSEESDDDLGGAFLIMERVEGDVPPSAPSFHAAGHFVRLGRRDRASAYRAGLVRLAELHRVGADDVGLIDVLGRAPTGREHLDASVRSLRDQYERMPEQHDDVVDAAFGRLVGVEMRDSPAVLCWGDPRPGNIVFRGATVVALLDWEMASLAPPESDVAWWLSLDEFQSVGMGHARLPGLPALEDVPGIYEELAGRRLHGLETHRLLAALRMAVIGLELQRLHDASQGAGRRPGRGLVLRHLERQLTRAGA